MHLSRLIEIVPTRKKRIVEIFLFPMRILNNVGGIEYCSLARISIPFFVSVYLFMLSKRERERGRKKETERRRILIFYLVLSSSEVQQYWDGFYLFLSLSNIDAGVFFSCSSLNIHFPSFERKRKIIFRYIQFEFIRSYKHGRVLEREEIFSFLFWFDN